jgi:hypothetical protein
MIVSCLPLFQGVQKVYRKPMYIVVPNVGLVIGIQQLASNKMPQWSQGGGQPWLQGGPQHWPQQQNYQWGPMGFSQWGGLASGFTSNMPPQ